jgi:hypothetical protein
LIVFQVQEKSDHRFKCGITRSTSGRAAASGSTAMKNIPANEHGRNDLFSQTTFHPVVGVRVR